MKPQRFRSRPTEVEAVVVTPENVAEVAEWCQGDYILIDTHASVGVPTINGKATALVGHWVVKGPHDFYPCDPDTFASRWEPVT